jgi:hypothetical protein
MIYTGTASKTKPSIEVSFITGPAIGSYVDP